MVSSSSPQIKTCVHRGSNHSSQFFRYRRITPQTIKKAVRDLISISKAAEASDEDFRKDPESMDAKELGKLAKELEKKMRQAAAELNFEEAAKLRDRMMELKKHLLEVE